MWKDDRRQSGNILNPIEFTFKWIGEIKNIFISWSNSLYGLGLGKRAVNIEEETSTSVPNDQSIYDRYDRGMLIIEWQV